MVLPVLPMIHTPFLVWPGIRLSVSIFFAFGGVIFPISSRVLIPLSGIFSLFGHDSRLFRVRGHDFYVCACDLCPLSCGSRHLICNSCLFRIRGHVPVDFSCKSCPLSCGVSHMLCNFRFFRVWGHGFVGSIQDSRPLFYGVPRLDRGFRLFRVRGHGFNSYACDSRLLSCDSRHLRCSLRFFRVRGCPAGAPMRRLRYSGVRHAAIRQFLAAASQPQP